MKNSTRSLAGSEQKSKGCRNERMRTLISGTKGFSQFLEKLIHRGEAGFADVAESVRDILKRVRIQGDRALVQLTRKYDGWKATPKNLRVSRRDMEVAWRGLSREGR